MGKGKRLKSERRQRGPYVLRDIVMVDACEIEDAPGGIMTIRGGTENAPPVPIALPSQLLPDLIEALHAASLDAEENYWDVVIPLAQSVPDAQHNQDAVLEIVHRRVLREDWNALANHVDAAPEEIFLLTQAAHVAMVIDPPFTLRPTVAIFDPLQLRRLEPALRQATANARRAAPAGVSKAAVVAAVAELSGRPWTDLNRANPTQEQAEAEMHRRRLDFLSRSPYMRPEDHILHLDQATEQTEAHTPR